MRMMDHMKTLKGCDNGAKESIARTYCYYLKLINKTILDPGLIMCHCSAVKLLRDVAFLASSKSSFFFYNDVKTGPNSIKLSAYVHDHFPQEVH